MLQWVSIWICAVMLAQGTAVLADEQIAKKLFKEGTALFEQKDYPGAADRFRKAYTEQPNWKLLYNIGQSEAAAKRYGKAMEAFEIYLSEGGDEISQSRLEEIEAELDRLQRLVGFVEIIAPDGARVVIDDDERGVCPLPGKVMVAAGAVHTLRIIYGERELVNRPLKVSGTQTITVSAVDNASEGMGVDAEHDSGGADSVASSASAAAKEESPLDASQQIESTRVRRSSILIRTGIGLIATGGAGIIGGVITGVVALKKSDELKVNCPTGVCLPEFHDENRTKETLATSSTILLISGATLAAAGTILLILGKWKGKQHVTVLPAVNDRTGSLYLSGRF